MAYYLRKENKKKGPSKKNKHEPIIGQALLLDADLVPVAMQMYPEMNLKSLTSGR